MPLLTIFLIPFLILATAVILLKSDESQSSTINAVLNALAIAGVNR